MINYRVRHDSPLPAMMAAARGLFRDMELAGGMGRPVASRLKEAALALAGRLLKNVAYHGNAMTMCRGIGIGLSLEQLACACWQLDIRIGTKHWRLDVERSRCQL